MDEAFDIWQSPVGKDLDRQGITRELTPTQRMAFVLGTMNYQVENGGFYQWHSNGYSANISDTRWALGKIDTPAAKTVLSILEDAENAINDGEAEHDEYGDLLNDDISYEFLDDLKVDDRYYSINKQLVDDIEAYFIANA